MAWCKSGECARVRLLDEEDPREPAILRTALADYVRRIAAEKLNGAK